MKKMLFLTMILAASSAMASPLSDLSRHEGKVLSFWSSVGKTYVVLNDSSGEAIKVIINQDTPKDIRDFLWDPALRGEFVTLFTKEVVTESGDSEQVAKALIYRG